MAWNNSVHHSSIGAWDPQKYDGEEVTVFSAEDLTKQKILFLSFAMNEKVSIYLQYKKAGKEMPFANEEAQRSVQELFSLVRESAILWMAERERKLAKTKIAKRKNMDKIQDMGVEIEEDKNILSALDILDNGGNAIDEFLVMAKRFLNKYIYHRGISKFERENRDPVDDYAKQAYGNEYKEEEE